MVFIQVIYTKPAIKCWFIGEIIGQTEKNTHKFEIQKLCASRFVLIESNPHFPLLNLVHEINKVGVFL